MILAPPALHLLLSAAIAVSTPDPTTCAANDLQCVGETNTAAAALAEPGARVPYLYRAHRAYKALADRDAPQRSHHLCRARALILQARKLPPPASLRTKLADSERETLAELAADNIDCNPRRRTRKAEPPPPAFDAAPDPVSPADAAPRAADPVSPADAAPRDPPLASPDPSPTSLTSSVAPAPIPGRELTQRRRPSRRDLLIAGGASLASGLALTGLTVFLGLHATEANVGGWSNLSRDQIYDKWVQDRAYRSEYTAYASSAAVLGTVGGASLVAAIVLLAVGAGRRSRTSERHPSLLPARTGLLFTAKF